MKLLLNRRREWAPFHHMAVWLKALRADMDGPSGCQDGSNEIRRERSKVCLGKWPGPNSPNITWIAQTIIDGVFRRSTVAFPRATALCSFYTCSHHTRLSGTF